MQYLNQIQALGYNPHNVKHIILSHLDIDHMSGIVDFPQATIHLFKSELTAALNPKGKFEQARYQHLSNYDYSNWELYDYSGSYWKGLESINLRNLPAIIQLIPLEGHTLGHCGIAIEHETNHHTFFIADACLDTSDLHQEKYKTINLFSMIYNSIMHVDKIQYSMTKKKLQTFTKFHHQNVTFINAHQPLGLML
jgi:glyoxylase-like metal-dependent hydrolase (beta-lactamase superfamily II)